MSVMDTFLRNTLYLMRNSAISQQTLADRSGISQQRLSAVLRGRSRLRLDESDRIASALGAPLHDMLTERDTYDLPAMSPEFAEAVHAGMDAAGMTQTDLARQLGTTQAAVSQWLAGKRRVSAARCRQIADALRLTATPAPSRSRSRSRRRLSRPS
jgi:transcriptional regulator with XRE-family HTH domain